MSSLLVLPPRFLLPAWSGAQLAQLRALHATAPRSAYSFPTFTNSTNGKPAEPKRTASQKKKPLVIRKHLIKLIKSDAKFSTRNTQVRAARENAGEETASSQPQRRAPSNGQEAKKGSNKLHLRAGKRERVASTKILGKGVDRISHSIRTPREVAAETEIAHDGITVSGPAVTLNSNEQHALGLEFTGAHGIIRRVAPDDQHMRDNYPDDVESLHTSTEAQDAFETSFPADPPDIPATSPPRLSLFEELFPAEAKREQGESAPSLFQELFSPEAKHAQQPRADSTGPQLEDLRLGQPSARSRRSKTDSILDFVPSPLQKRHWQQDRLTIMVVMGLSPYLEEADFQRLLPRGEHIPEWRSPGDVLRVITARDADTLAPRALHYLIFANPTMAKAYKSYLEHVHALARQYTPTSLLSDPVPPRGYFIQGTNIHQLLQDYTLCAPSQDLHVRVLLPPYDRRLRTLLAHQGYAALQQPRSQTESEASSPSAAPLPPKAGRSVLLWVDGFAPETGALRAMLSLDGRRRGLKWGVKTPEGGVVELLDHRSSESEDEAGHGRADASSDADETMEEQQRRGERLAPPRWLVTLRDESEARRFVRAWHRRPYVLNRDERERLAPRDRRARDEDGVLPVVHAQFVW